MLAANEIILTAYEISFLEYCKYFSKPKGNNAFEKYNSNLRNELTKQFERLFSEIDRTTHWISVLLRKNEQFSEAGCISDDDAILFDALIQRVICKFRHTSDSHDDALSLHNIIEWFENHHDIITFEAAISAACRPVQSYYCDTYMDPKCNKKPIIAPHLRNCIDKAMAENDKKRLLIICENARRISDKYIAHLDKNPPQYSIGFDEIVRSWEEIIDLAEKYYSLISHMNRNSPRPHVEFYGILQITQKPLQPVAP